MPRNRSYNISTIASNNIQRDNNLLKDKNLTMILEEYVNECLRVQRNFSISIKKI